MSNFVNEESLIATHNNFNYSYKENVSNMRKPD
jgi:hypothetical protein